MTTPTNNPVGSMRFEINEVLSGMLATVEEASFTDDAPRLAAMFEGLSGRFALLAPFQHGVDPIGSSPATASCTSSCGYAPLGACAQAALRCD